MFVAILKINHRPTVRVWTLRRATSAPPRGYSSDDLANISRSSRPATPPHPIERRRCYILPIRRPRIARRCVVAAQHSVLAPSIRSPVAIKNDKNSIGGNEERKIDNQPDTAVTALELTTLIPSCAHSRIKKKTKNSRKTCARHGLLLGAGNLAFFV